MRVDALLGLATWAFTTDTDVDDLRGIGVDWCARDAQPSRPAHPVQNVAAAARIVNAKHPHRHDLRAPTDADATDAIVPSGDGSSHVCAVIAGIATLVLGVGIAPVAVASIGQIADEIVTRDEHSCEVWVRNAARVHDRDRHRTARRAIGDVPRVGKVHRRVVPLESVGRVARGFESA